MTMMRGGLVLGLVGEGGEAGGGDDENDDNDDDDDGAECSRV